MKLVRVTKENIDEAAAVQNELFPEENGRANFEASLQEGSRFAYALIYHFGKSTTPDRPDQTWVNCLNLFVAGYTV